MSTSYNFRRTTRPTGAPNVAPPRRRHATTGTGRRPSASASLPSASRGLLLAARLRRAAAARHAGDGSAGDHGVLRTVARHRAAPHRSSLTARHAFLRSAHHRHERRLEKRGSPPSPRARAPGELPLAAHRPFGPHRGVYERYSTKHEADRLPLARALSPQTGAGAPVDFAALGLPLTTTTKSVLDHFEGAFKDHERPDGLQRWSGTRGQRAELGFRV